MTQYYIARQNKSFRDMFNAPHLERAERRLAPRFDIKIETPVMFLVSDDSIAGVAHNESDSGLKVISSTGFSLNHGDNVRMIYRRATRLARVTRVVPRRDGVHVGLRWV